jgi:transcriptional regulator with XRE-family HTH domain
MKETAISKKLPKRLKQLRMDRGWSQGQVSKKLGVDTQRISKYERGVLCPTPDIMVKLADIYETSLDFLMRDNKEQPIPYIQNKKMLDRIEKINQLSEKNQSTLIEVIDAFIRQDQLEEIMKGT